MLMLAKTTHRRTAVTTDQCAFRALTEQPVEVLTAHQVAHEQWLADMGPWLASVWGDRADKPYAQNYYSSAAAFGPRLTLMGLPVPDDGTDPPDGWRIDKRSTPRMLVPRYSVAAGKRA